VDPYLDPETWVLVNEYGIRDRAELREVEDDVAGAAMATLSEASLPGEYGWALLSEIHRLLFQHVYAWAGSRRTVGIAKDQASPFMPPELIDEELESIALELAEFPADVTRPELLAFLVSAYRRLNHAHPFREGNGRTQRAFWELFCREYGYALRWDRVEKEENDSASRDADRGHSGPLTRMLDRILVAEE
jgi:cell filamentation protein